MGSLISSFPKPSGVFAERIYEHIKHFEYERIKKILVSQDVFYSLRLESMMNQPIGRNIDCPIRCLMLYGIPIYEDKNLENEEISIVLKDIYIKVPETPKKVKIKITV